MYTGIVQDIGTVLERSENERVIRVRIASRVSPALEIGGSVNVSGVCLTVVSFDDESFEADIMPETVRKTNLGSLEVGSHANIEPSLRANAELGGGFVAGHVDATAEIVAISDDAKDRLVTLRIPEAFMPLVARKGSITLDGANLTIVDVDDAASTLRVALIPHTLAVTTLSGWAVGDSVNMEIDMLARYVQRLVTHPNHKHERFVPSVG